MARSKIEWTDVSWNVVTGCTKVSAGCQHCYAERMAKRLAGRCGYPGAHLTTEQARSRRGPWPAEGPFSVTLHPDRLGEPLHWRKPKRVLVCSMGDLFHPDVPDEFIDRVFAVMATAWTVSFPVTLHTFQVLTKRPERMAQYLGAIPDTRRARIGGWVKGNHRQRVPDVSWHGSWPLRNVWLGTSVEDQPTADERIPHLLRCPAAVRFVSYEPAIAPLDLAYSVFNGADSFVGLEGIGWVIAGGESGPGARPAHQEWFRSVRDQCAAAGVPFFFKQWGQWGVEGQTVPVHRGPLVATAGEYDAIWPDGTRGAGTADVKGGEGAAVWRVGKKAAGHLLDGREHREFPKARA
jgi:protein gp37